MSYSVEIRRNADGVIHKYEDNLPWEDHSEFMWTDGNYGCDCNRGLFFGYAVGEKGEDIEVECGEGAFSVRIWNDGKIVYDEFDRINEQIPSEKQEA